MFPIRFIGHVVEAPASAASARPRLSYITFRWRSCGEDPKSLEKTKFESLDGSSPLSCLVRETPRSSALLISTDLHFRLSGQILHRPKLCLYHTRNPASELSVITTSVSKSLLQPSSMPLVMSTCLGSTPLSFEASFRAAAILSGMV